MSTLLNLLRWGLQMMIPGVVRDYVFVQYATISMEKGLYYDALSVGDQISSLVKRDRLFAGFAQGFVDDGDVRTAREIVERIDDFSTIAFVWAMIASHTEITEDYTAFERALSKVPDSETEKLIYLRREVLKPRQNSRR